MADNQHFISQAHLRQFIHPKSKDQVLYPYAKGGGPQRPRGTAKLASAIDFYVQRIAGKPNNKIDEHRKQAEKLIFASGKGSAGTLSRCIHDDRFIVDHAKALDLASAAAFLKYGSPLEIHNAAMAGSLSNQIYALNTLNSDTAKEHYREQYGDTAEEQIEADREAILNGQLFVDVGEENWKQSGFFAFKLMELFVRSLLSMKLTIVDAYGDDFFVTSDHPVVVHSRSQPDAPGIAMKDASAWFPISYKRALLWHREKHPPREAFSTRQTRDKNKLMLKWCYKFIYSPLPDPWIEAAARAETFNPCYGHYRTLNDVINKSAPAFLPDGTHAGEVVDLLSALRGGEPVDLLGI